MKIRKRIAMFLARRREKTRREKKSEGGFSLLEIMTVATIMAMSATAILTLIGESYRMNKMAWESTVASSAIKTKIEEIRLAGFGNATTYNNQTFSVLGLKSVNGSTPIGSITVAADALQEEVYNVNVTLQWKGIIGNRSLTATTRLADMEITSE